MEKDNKLTKGNMGIIVVVVVLLVLVGGYFLYKNRQAVKNMLMPSSQNQTSTNDLTPTEAMTGISPTVTGVPTGGTSNSQIDSQMNNVQVNMNGLDQDQQSVTSINQNADNAAQ